MATPGGANQIARHVIDDLIEFSEETSVDGYMSFFKSQQIAESRGFISRMHEEANTARNLVGQLNALIAEMEALEYQGEVFNTLMDLRDDKEAVRTKLKGLNELITQADPEIETKEAQIQAMKGLRSEVNVDSNDSWIWKALLSLREKARKHIEYKIGNGEWISVWHDKWCEMIDNDKWKWHNEWKDVFPELISIPIPSCSIHKDKAIGESNSRLRVEKSRPEAFETMVELSSLYIGVLLFKRYGSILNILQGRNELLEKIIGNESYWSTSKEFQNEIETTYILPNQDTLSKLDEVPVKYSAILKAEEWIENKEIKPDEEPPRGIMWLKGRVNKDGQFPDDEIRSVGDKLKETKDKIKKGTLKVDHGTDAMTVVLGKEKGGYARGVGSGVTYKRYFDLPRSRQASDERIALLQSQLDNERCECQEKELEIQNLSNKMSKIEGMVSKLMNQLAAQGQQLQTISTKLTPSDVRLLLCLSPVDINPIHNSADEEGGTPLSLHGCENDASIQKSNGLATSEKEMETRETVNSVGSKKRTKSLRKESSRQHSQSQENVSPLLTDRKQMLHNKELPKDCYKVSVDKSLVDAACIPDVGNNGFKTVKDAVGGFFAWPKDQVVLDLKATPSSTIQMIGENKTAPKLQSKRKNVYVSRDAMQKQARMKSQKSLNY
ncbi:hypothetical protein Tco_0080292 [Tanacetum coccineum]